MFRVSEAVLFMAGCIISWLIAHIYYRRSSTHTPKWARELVKHFPECRPALGDMVKLFQEYVDSGEINITHPLGRVACPECGEAVANFKEQRFSDAEHAVAVYTCPNCGWSDHCDFS